ncbi:dimethyladenosine transferase [Mycoplasmopsis arginini]|nr:16S rRNA (adenine(1518)-N(6)/adenine(1519)-N(6))-dimethyltransferase RsmA [Mycoplasmopsis arginini]VEU81391.1 dimethyladenosine transferase [Mycoplasmopsis arginini]
MEVIAKKSFGQNFLINKKIQKRIVEAAEVKDEDVIEIGPGLGAITNLIINEVKTLDAYELDKEIFSLWIEKKLPKNINFINQDFLESNLAFDSKRVVVGNIPYNITSPIIFKLIENHHFIKRATIMVQKEVGERLIAIIGTKSYSKLSVSIQSVAKVSKVLVAKASDFSPAPKVDSMVVKIEFFENLDFNLDNFLLFIKKCFQFKRKKLINNLLSDYDKDTIIKIFNDLNINLLVRPENISIAEYKQLFLEFSKIIKNS